MATLVPMSLSVSCPGDLLPSGSFKTELKDMYQQLGGLPSRLYLAGEEAAGDAIKDIMDGIESTMGIFPIGYAGFGTVKIPEMEWEARAEAIADEYKFYVQVQILGLISVVIPVNLVIPILGLNIDIVRVFSDKTYRDSLITQIANSVPEFLALIPSSLQILWNKELAISSPGVIAGKIWKYISSQLKTLSYQLLWDAFGALIKKFKTIWDALGLPAIPDLMTIDWNSLVDAATAPFRGAIRALVDQIEALSETPGVFEPDGLGDQLMQQLSALYEGLRDSIMGVSIFGFSLGSILDLDPGKILNQTFNSINRTMEEWTGAIHGFSGDWPQYLLEVWVVKIKPFLDAIGLGAILDWVAFTMCDFLQFIGLPTNVTVQVQG